MQFQMDRSLSVKDLSLLSKQDRILQMIKWLSNVAAGMVYLADNKILHKDLSQVSQLFGINCEPPSLLL